MAPPPPVAVKRKLNDAADSSSNNIVFAFDKLKRNNQVLTQFCEDKFLAFLIGEESAMKGRSFLEKENIRLNSELQKAIVEAQRLEQKLMQARNLLSEETFRAKKAEQEKQIISDKFMMVRELLTAEHGNTLNNETRQKLQRLEASVSSLRGAAASKVITMSPGGALELSVVNEINSTGSILDVSDLSIDATCDPTLDESRTRSGRSFKRKSSDHGKRRSHKKSRGSAGLILEQNENTNQGMYVKDRETVNTVQLATRKSWDKIQARRSIRKSLQKYQERNIDDYLPTPSAPPLENNAEACWREAHLNPSQQNSPNVVEAVTPRNTCGVQRSHSNAGINSRRHMFDQKKVYNFDPCGPCGNKLKWGKTAYKCRDCRAVAHPECKDQVPLPCISVGSVKATTPGKAVHTLADYTPAHAPMVPALIVHCVNEIEKRGLMEVGLYRVPGSERDVKELKERFFRGKGCPNLAKVDDVHTLCGCIKDFLKGLREPLIPPSQWKEFIQATRNEDPTDVDSALVQAISKLPQPNVDTLAFLLVHFRNVSDVVENKMTLTNLAKILAPTVVGYSKLHQEAELMWSELPHITLCMEKLLGIEPDFWQRFLGVEEGDNLYPPPIRANLMSPSTPELFQPIARDTGLTPRSRPHIARESVKHYFDSPMLH